MPLFLYLYHKRLLSDCKRTSSHKHCSHPVTLLYLFRLSFYLSAAGPAPSASSYTAWLLYVKASRLSFLQLSCSYDWPSRTEVGEELWHEAKCWMNSVHVCPNIDHAIDGEWRLAIKLAKCSKTRNLELCEKDRSTCLPNLVVLHCSPASV